MIDVALCIVVSLGGFVIIFHFRHLLTLTNVKVVFVVKAPSNSVVAQVTDVLGTVYFITTLTTKSCPVVHGLTFARVSHGRNRLYLLDEGWIVPGRTKL